MATLLLDQFYFDNLGILKGNASLFLWFSFQDSMNVHLISFLPFFHDTNYNQASSWQVKIASMIVLYLSGSLDSQGTAKLDDMHCIDEVYAFSDDDI